MAIYEDDDYLDIIARECKNFSRDKSSRFRQGEISCLNCRKWDGTGCSAGELGTMMRKTDVP